jgi:cytochrome c biogenesis protein ResB
LGKRKISTQKKPKSKKSAALIFILLICFSIFLCLFVHELVNKLGTTGMRACLTKTTRERERERERRHRVGVTEDEEDEGEENKRINKQKEKMKINILMI